MLATAGEAAFALILLQTRPGLSPSQQRPQRGRPAALPVNQLRRQERGRGDPGVGGGHPGARHAVAPLRPAVPASAPNPPFPPMALIRVALRGRGDALGWERPAAGLGRGSGAKPETGHFVSSTNPEGRPRGRKMAPAAAPARTPPGPAAPAPAPAPRTRSCGRDGGEGEKARRDASGRSFANVCVF